MYSIPCAACQKDIGHRRRYLKTRVTQHQKNTRTGALHKCEFFSTDSSEKKFNEILINTGILLTCGLRQGIQKNVPTKLFSSQVKKSHHTAPHFNTLQASEHD